MLEMVPTLTFFFRDNRYIATLLQPSNYFYPTTALYFIIAASSHIAYMFAERCSLGTRRRWN